MTDWDKIIQSGFLTKEVDPRKAKCSECQYMRRILGNAHIQCDFYGKLGTFILVLGLPMLTVEKKDTGERLSFPLIELPLNEWTVAYPVEFDPAWLVSCLQFYMPKKKEDEDGNS